MKALALASALVAAAAVAQPSPNNCARPSSSCLSTYFSAPSQSAAYATLQPGDGAFNRLLLPNGNVIIADGSTPPTLNNFWLASGYKAGNGAAGSPSFTFTSESTLGWFRSGTAAIALSSGAKLCFGSTGILCWTNNAGLLTFDATGAVVFGNTNVSTGADMTALTFTGNGGAKFGQVTEQTFGTVPTSVSDVSYGSARWLTHQGSPHPGNTRRIGYGTILTTSDTSITVVGMSAITNLGTATSAPATDTTRNLVNYATGAVSGNTAGFVGPLTQTRMSYHPAFSAGIRTDTSAITSTRIYVGLTSADLSGLASLAATNAIHYCAFRYDTGIGDTAWQACSSDGTTASCSSTGVTVAAATTVDLAVDHSSDTTCEFYVNGVVKVSKSSNISLSSSVNVGPQVEITTLTTAARNLLINKFSLEHK